MPRIRLVVTAGSAQGRGHLARALSMAEARWGPGTRLELELLDGALSEGEVRRAEAVSLRQVPAGSPTSPSTSVILDIPEFADVPARFDAAALVVFDDRNQFAGHAAIVIQPSQAVWSGTGAAETVLSGYEYVPISAAVRRQRSTGPGRPPAGARPHLLVCFGGSDPADVTGRFAPALAAFVDADLEVIVGPSYQGSTDRWSVTVLRDPPDLVERLAAADLVLLGAGTMKYEAACLARPMALLAVADDQLPVGPAFASTGAARYSGDGRTVDPAEVAEALTALLADPAARNRLGARAAQVVDGNGADRIAIAVERLGQPAGRS